MKKLIILLVLSCVFFSIANLCVENNIFETSAQVNSDNKVVINLKSDYKNDVKVVKEGASSFYFDIKNATLAKSYSALGSENLSILTQQIGKKVRVYLKGDIDGVLYVNSISNWDKTLPDYGFLSLLTGILSLLFLLVFKIYSATIRLKEETFYIKAPMTSAMSLNKKLYTIDRRKPEIITAKKYSNPIENDVYDFEFAKNKNNVKIAI